MLLATYKKQPWEEKDYDVDYTEWLAEMTPADALSNATATAAVIPRTGDVSPDSTPLTVSSVTITATKAKLMVIGGTSGKKYKVTLRVTTQGVDGVIRKDESELIFDVKDL